MFQIEPYRNPFAMSLATLVGGADRAHADALERAGTAIAQGGQQVGQEVGTTLGNLVQMKREQPQTELAQQQVDAGRRAVAYNGAINQIMSTALTQNPDGTRTVDRSKLRQSLAGSNVPVAMQEQIFKSLDEVDSSVQKFQQVRFDHVADLAHGVIQTIDAGVEPHSALMTGFALAKANGIVTDDQIKPIIDAVSSGADVRSVLSSVRSMSDKYKDLSKPVVLPRPGSKVVNPLTGQTMAESPVAPPRPVNVPPGGVLVNPETGAVVATGGATPTPSQTHTMRLAGVGDVPVDYVPGKDGTGGKWMYQGEDVTGKVKAIPPASIQIQNLGAAAVSSLPDWALDDSRPAGAEANKVDPKVRMTPNGLYQSALTYISTGQYPPTGRGNDPAAQAVRAAINSKSGAIAAATGMDTPTLRAFYKSNASSLTQQQKFSDSAQAFMATADKNADLLEGALRKMPDTGSPLLNQPLRAFSQKVAGNPDMAPIATYLQSVRNEYGKLITNPNLAGQLTDSARHDTEQLLSDDATVGQLLGSIRALKSEGTNRLLSVGDQINVIQQRLQNPGGAAQGASKSGTAPGAPAGVAVQPKEGDERVINGTPAVWKTVRGKAGWYAK